MSRNEREREREGGREGGREGEREGGREGERESSNLPKQDDHNDCTSCGQVHELPQSHCGDNREGTLL